MQPPHITVWIHGTKLQHLFGPLSTMHIESLHQFMYCKPGLHRAQELDSSFHHYDIAHTLHQSDSTKFFLEHIYLFGWSGLLHAQERLDAAQNLFQALDNLVQDYVIRYQCSPYIRIITHSHGGNVALNLAHIAQEKGKQPFVIDELILMACPVQKATAQLVHSHLFSKVYSLHSHWDFVQIADPQGWPLVKPHVLKFLQSKSLGDLKAGFMRMEQEPFFSGRHFEPHEKLTQVVVKVDNKHLMHVQFILLPFVQNMSYILETIENEQHHQKEHDLLITLPM